MAKLKTILEGMVAGIGIYVFTLLGILLSQYAPLLLRDGPINTPFQWIRLGISAVIALYIVSTDESQGDPAGKAKNWRRRMATAFSHGFMWNGIIGIAGQAAGQ